jgi:hypothetical protein
MSVSVVESPRARSAGRHVIGFSAQSLSDPIFTPRLGFQFPRQMAFEKWLGIGRQLSAGGSSLAWCLGDWLTYGEETYNGRYRDAIEQTSLEYQTLRNYAWVSRRFPLSRRRDTLSFGHHAEVASLAEPEQEFWLRKAEGLSWSRNRLRQEVRASLRERSLVAGPEQSADPADASGRPGDQTSSGPGLSHSPGDRLIIEICLTPAQLRSCRVAADRAGLSVEEWAARALHEAAKEGTLGPSLQSHTLVCRRSRY